MSEKKLKTKNDQIVLESFINDINSKNKISNVVDESNKEDTNFDSIDFNMDPFNKKYELVNKEDIKDSKELFSMEKEDNKNHMTIFNNNINSNKLNLKSNSSNNYEMNSNYKNIGSNDNTGIMDYLNNINNNNTHSSINYMSPIYLKNNLFYNNINKSIGYKDIALNKNNIMNIPFNYGNNKNSINPNFNNINNNRYIFKTARQIWICPFCKNYNSEGKLQKLINIIFEFFSRTNLQ